VPPSERSTAPTGLRIRGLRKWYGETRALDGLDIEARPGEILGIAGPNGAGKSTLIKILAAETRADEGAIELDAQTWDPDLHRDRVAVVHQEPQLFPNLTVADNLIVGREGTRAMRRGLNGDERALLAALGILYGRRAPGAGAAGRTSAHRDRSCSRPIGAHLPFRRAELGAY
jgi:ABC-type sugar transport system ATPase subunit